MQRLGLVVLRLLEIRQSVVVGIGLADTLATTSYLFATRLGEVSMRRLSISMFRTMALRCRTALPSKTSVPDSRA